MKINKKLCVLAGLVVCAFSSQAAYTVSVTAANQVADPQTVYTGSTATIYTDFTIQLSGTGSPSPDTLELQHVSSLKSPFEDDLAGDMDSIVYAAPGTSAAVANLKASSFTAVGDGTYNVVVSWTLDAGAVNGDALQMYLGVTDPNSNGAFSDAYIDVVTATVPEPAQTVAGAMLLGCGGLVFAGRRLFKKQVA